jgi:hypothetical protein
MGKKAFCALRLGDAPTALNVATEWREHPDARPDTTRVFRRTFLPLAAKVSRLVFDPPDAHVVVDGVERRIVSGVLYVRPGVHAIVATHEKGRIEAKPFLDAGETMLVTVPAAMPDPAVSEADPPDAETPPAAAHGMPLVAAAMPTLPDVTPHRGFTPATIVFASIAAASIGVGAGLMAWSGGDRNRAAVVSRQAMLNGDTCYGQRTAECTEAANLTSAGTAKQTAAIGCFAGAFAFLTSAVVFHFAQSSSDPPPFQVSATAIARGALVSGGAKF